MAEHPAYPVGLRLTGRRVVVLGGGQVAQRRLPALIAAGADILLVSPSATPSVEAMADAGETHLGAPPLRGRRPRRRLVRPDRDQRHRRPTPPPPPRPKRTASGASAPTTPTRRPPGRRPPATARASRSPSSPRTPRAATPATPPPSVTRSSRACATAPSSRPHHRTRAPGVALVGGGPGDPDLITVRGRRLLAEADVVIADRLGPRDLLDELPAARRGDRRREDPVRPFHGPGGHQRRADRARQGGQGRSYGSRAATRTSSAAAWRRPRRWPRRASPARSSPASPAPISRPGRGRHPGHPPRRRPRVHRGQRPCRPRRRTLPGRLGVPRQAARHPRPPDGRRQDRRDRRDPGRARQVRRTPRSPWSRRARRRPSAASTPPSRPSPRRSVAEDVTPPGGHRHRRRRRRRPADTGRNPG